MNVLRTLRRAVRRLNRSMEKTALAASVVQSEGAGGTHPNAAGVRAVLGEIEQTDERERERDDDEG